MHPPRDFQNEAIENVFELWQTHHSVLAEMATGLGKTRVAVEVTKRFLPRRTLFLAHREELIWQTRNEYLEQGIECDVEKAELAASNSLFSSPVVVAMVQSMKSGKIDAKRMHRFRPTDFALVIYDECFPAGTLVDGVPIESIKVGDLVTSGSLIKRKVMSVFKTKPSSLVRVRYEDGLETVCTGNHPVWDCSCGCFVPASLLTKHSTALRLTVTYDKKMQNVRDGVLCKESNQKTLQSRMSKQLGKALCDGRNEEALVRANEEAKSHAQEGKSGQDVHHIESDWPSPNYQRRQREATNPTRGDAGIGTWLDNRILRSDWLLERQWRDAATLHSGCGKPFIESGCGGGWRLTRVACAPDSGCEAGFILEGARVDSVEVLKQGSDGTFGGLCPDGCTYNLHVETDNTYWANGILVHNCHGSVSIGNKSIVDYFVNGNPDLRVLGLTATPDRADNISLSCIFQAQLRRKYDILFGIENGWLVEPVPQMVTLGALDISHVRATRKGDFNEADLSAVLEQEEAVAGLVQPTYEAMFGLPINTLTGLHPKEWRAILEANGKPIRTIVFTVSVKQAEMAANGFNRVWPGIAGWVCGETRKDSRKDLFRQFENGDVHILCNVGVATEGYNNPNVGMVVLARPTMSRRLCAQMVGRVTRPLRGLVDSVTRKESRLLKIALSTKPTGKVLDFACVTGKHKLVTVGDLLAGGNSPEAVKRAMEIVRKAKEPMKVKDIIAEEELNLQKEIEQLRLAEEAKKVELVARVRYTTESVDPFDLSDTTAGSDGKWRREGKFSLGERKTLQRGGFNPEEMPYQEGKRMCRDLYYRWRNGLCTHRQEAFLRNRGYDTQGMKKDEASKLIDKLKQTQ